MPCVLVRRVVLLCMVLPAAWLAGCGDPNTGADVRDVGIDATMDTPGSNDVPEDVQCRTNADCDNHVYCDGEERCLGGQCVAGTSACDDRHSCTVDRCDEAMRACTHMNDDSMCGDRNACNGVERCDPAAPGSNGTTGCTPVRPDNILDCDDGNTCTIDTCDMMAGCIHAPRDLDGDGHVDRACTIDGTPGGPAGDDCNDGDPSVYPMAMEICDDSRDNNCDGRVDYFDPSCTATNDNCARARVLPGPGMYFGTTVGSTNDYMLSCGFASATDVVFEFTLTSVQDVTVSLSTSDANASVAIVSNCSPLSEVRCGRGTFSTAPQVRVRSLMPGTYRIIVETGTTPQAFRLSLRYDSATTTPPEDLCPVTEPNPAVELNDGMPHTANLATLEDDYVLSCNMFSGGSRDAVYRLTLAAPSDVVLTAAPMAVGFSQTYMSFRTSPCVAASSERACRSAFDMTGIRSIHRSLAAGTYWIIVENSANSPVVVQAAITTPPAPTVTYAMSSPTTVTWTDICAAPGSTRVLAVVDDATASIPASAIPFPLRVYGINITPPITLTSNGYIVFAPGGSFPLSGTVPDPSAPNLVVAGYWTDLYTRSTGICYGATGTAPNRRFIVQWQDLHYCCTMDPGVHLTFEIVINEAPMGTSNTIDVIYQTMMGVSRTGGAGIENDDGTVGTAIPAPFTAPRTVRLTPSM